MKRIISMFAIVAAVSATASAGVWTKKFDWAPQHGTQILNWTENGITVKQVTFDLGSVLRPSRISTSKALVRVDNDSAVDVVPGIAIAVFDAEDRLIAAGDGGVKVGDLNKGARDEFTVAFHHVFRNLDKAKSFYVTVETKR
jgi:hypothetical protein